MSKWLRSKSGEIISECSIHGIPKLVSQRNSKEKLFWLIVIIIAFSCCSWLILLNILEYLDYPVITNINTIYEHNAEFPTVQFCGFSSYKCNFNTKDCNDSHLIEYPLSCITFNSGHNRTGHPLGLLYIDQNGRNALRLRIQPKEDENTINVSFFNRTKNSKFYFQISVGTAVDLSITRTFVTKLGAPYSDCRKELTFKLGPMDLVNKTSYPYVQYECFRLCKDMHIAQECNRSEEFKRIKQMFYTNFVYYNTNYNSIVNSCSKKNAFLIENVNKKFREEGEGKICKEICPIECNSIDYGVVAITRIENQTKNALVNIFYQDFTYTYISQIPKNTPESLFANIGGTLGLFLGTSFLSFVELLDIIYHLFFITTMVSKKPTID